MSTTVKVYSAESPLRDPGRFVTEAAQDLVASRDFAGRLFRQFIAQRYRHSSLGLLWAFAPPIVTTLLLTLVRHNASTSGSSLSPQLYAVFGLMMAQTFLETFYTQRTIFSANRALLKRQRGTVEALILAGLYDNLLGFGIKAAILAGFMIACHTTVSTFVLGLLGIGIIFLLGSGLGLCLAPFSAIKADVDKILTFLPWLLFGLTPIFAPAASAPGLSRLYDANPFTWLFDAVRAVAFGHAQTSVSTLVLCMVSLCLFPCAALTCRIARPHVVERFLD